MASTAERLKQALKIRNMKQSELSERTGIGKSSISTYLSGAYIPKQKNTYLMAKALDVNEAWLMGADVPMERTLEGLLFSAALNSINIEEFEKLSEDGQFAALEFGKWYDNRGKDPVPMSFTDSLSKFEVSLLRAFRALSGDNKIKVYELIFELTEEETGDT